MAEAKSIETLSLSFTAGVAAGTMVSGLSGMLFPGLLLPLIGLPLLFWERLPQWDDKWLSGLLAAVFSVLGLFCAAARLPAPQAHSFLQALASQACVRLQALIGTIPFPSAGTAPLLQALLTGDRSALSPDTVTAFRQSGASHILALSGLHLGILYLLIDKTLSLLGRYPAVRVLRLLTIVPAALFFTLMTGASPSLVRAFLFILINEILRICGRPRKAARVLCLALLVQLVLDPAIIRSLGFQLSYLAMAGIFLIYPVLERWYPGRGPLQRIWQAAALSISCQLTTAPLAWLRFHSFPRYFLLTNLLALPLTTCLMSSAIATLAWSAAGNCPALLIKTTDVLCNALQRTLEIIASL